MLDSDAAPKPMNCSQERVRSAFAPKPRKSQLLATTECLQHLSGVGIKKVGEGRNGAASI